MLSIGIIGGGPGGLIALYECKIRNIKVTLYEKQSHIGGVWNLESRESRAHRSTVFNTSELFSTFSLADVFPEDVELHKSDYFTSSQYQQYLNYVVEKYNLVKDIQCNQEVLNIIEDNSIFIVKVFDNVSSKIKFCIHDYIIISTGRNGTIKLPDESYLSKEIEVNKDLIWHSSFWDPLNNESNSANVIKKKDCSILVIGGSHSAAENIQDTLKSAELNHSIEGLTIIWSPTCNLDKHSVWMMDRYPFGDTMSIPLDQQSCRLYHALPKWLISRQLRKFTIPILLHKSKALPNIDKDTFCICDTLSIQNALKKGIIKIFSKPILRLRKVSLEHVLIETLNKDDITVDGVVLATGYDYGEVKINDKYILLTSKFYRGIIPLDKNLHGHVGIIGTSKVIGSSIGILQMETRWLLYQWFSNKSIFNETFKKLQLKESYECLEGTVCNTRRFPENIMDLLAKDIGIKPYILRNLFSIWPFPRHVTLACLLGPISIHQYSNPIESTEEKLYREKILLSNTIKFFKRTKWNFKVICYTADVIIYCGATFIAYSLFNYIKRYF